MVYVISTRSYIKIGRTKNIEERLNSLQTASPTRLCLKKSYLTKSEYEDKLLEEHLHREFSESRIYIGGRSTEWFSKDVLCKVDNKVEEFFRKRGITKKELSTTRKQKSLEDIKLENLRKQNKRLREAVETSIDSKDTIKSKAKVLLENKYLKKDNKKLKVLNEDLSKEVRRSVDLSRKNKELTEKIDRVFSNLSSLKDENSLLRKELMKTKDEQDSYDTLGNLLKVIDFYPELLTKWHLEELFQRPFYEVIDWAASIGAETKIGYRFYYKRDIIKEELLKKQMLPV